MRLLTLVFLFFGSMLFADQLLPKDYKYSDDVTIEKSLKQLDVVLIQNVDGVFSLECVIEYFVVYKRADIKLVILEAMVRREFVRHCVDPPKDHPFSCFFEIHSLEKSETCILSQQLLRFDKDYC